MNTLLYIPTLNKEKSTTLNHTLNKIIIEYIVSILLVTTPIAKLKKKKNYAKTWSYIFILNETMFVIII